MIWVKREPEYFCEGDWTGEPLICPSGKISRHGDGCCAPNQLNALIDRVAGHGDKVAHQAIGDLPVHGQLVLPLELLDRGLGV